MKVLITGANGFLGQHLTLFLATNNLNVMAVNRGNCRIPQKQAFQYISADITDGNKVEEMVTAFAPDVIIHAAAMSKPDECNADNNKCILQNVTATRLLLNAAKKANTSHFIYISTDFVFGENGPHEEDDVKGPLNFYGESKLMAENAVINSGISFTIIRPVFIYGEVWEGLRPSFLHWVKNNLVQGKAIKVVSDQQRTPTFVTDICKGILAVIQGHKTGIYHLAGKDIVSPYQMAVATAETLGLDATLIENVTSESFVEPVKRAKKSGLKINRAIAELNYQPVDFKEGVRYTFNIH